jgi:polyisoprenoid-binding protein YceI
MALFTRRPRHIEPQGEPAAHTLPPLPAGAGLLRCRVVDPVGLPMQAAVELIGPEGARVTNGSSDPFGMFVVTVPGGFYQLSVTADGFREDRRTVQVLDGTVAELPDIMLEHERPLTLPHRGRWDLDPAHSTIRLGVRHLGIGTIHGRFSGFRGSLRVGDRMEESLLQVTIDAASIDTGHTVRDDHLRSPDFLDVEMYPYLTFLSDRFTHRGGADWYVDGVLTLHGVSRTVRLDTTYRGLVTGMQGEPRAACTARTELRREDYTLDWQKLLARGVAAIGSAIQVEMDIQVLLAE